MTSLLVKLRDAAYVPFASFVMWLNSIIINSTLRIKLVGMDKIASIHARGERVIFAFWHQATFTMFYFYRGKDAVVIPVDNYLGSILAGFVKMYGYRVVRYPERGTPVERVQAVARLIKVIKSGHDCPIAVDGPPEEKLFNAKPGVFYMAGRTGFPVLPVGACYDRAFTFNFRWDKYLMPKPFSKVVLHAGEPIYVKEGLSEMDTEELCRKLEKELHRLTELAREACSKD